MHNIRVGVNKQENCKGINCQIVLRGLKVLKVLRVLQEYSKSTPRVLCQLSGCRNRDQLQTNFGFPWSCPLAPELGPSNELAQRSLSSPMPGPRRQHQLPYRGLNQGL